MKNDPTATINTAAVFMTNEIIIGFASFFSAGRFAENKIKGIPISTRTEEKSAARVMSAPAFLKGVLNRNPVT